MKFDEAFRVAIIPDMRTASYGAIDQASNRARALVLKILAPLKLGSLLEFGLEQEADARGWLVVRIMRSGQQSLFSEFDEGTDGEDTSPEAASARALMKRHIERLKEVMRQLRISGYQLEKIAGQMAQVAQLYSAFSIASQDRKRVMIKHGAVPIEDFVLSPQPGRYLGPRAHVHFRVQMMGEDMAMIHLPKLARPSVGARRAHCLLRWDANAVDAQRWEYLLSCMKRRVPVQAEVKTVFKATGTLAELLVVSIEEPKPASPRRGDADSLPLQASCRLDRHRPHMAARSADSVGAV